MRALLVAGLLLAGCGGVSSAELVRIVEESRPCSAGDACVLAGGSRCTCATAVNASQQERVDEAADEVDCGSKMVECQECLAPSCVGGLCACAH